MERIRPEEIVDDLSSEFRGALREAVNEVIPGARFDEKALFRAFKRAVGRKCTSWEGPPNEQLTTAAWEALARGDYQEAIAQAKQCIDEFGVAAEREQKDLETQGAPQPRSGKVPDEEKETISSRGLLNDVAASYFILGKALEARGEMKAVEEAYQSAAKFTYARTWDPRGEFFWIPAQGASDQLLRIQRSRNP